jgi:hypothetical protein
LFAWPLGKLRARPDVLKWRLTDSDILDYAALAWSDGLLELLRFVMEGVRPEIRSAKE